MGFRLLTSDLVRDVRDTQCGFKFFDGEAARRLFSDISLTGFVFDVEILALAAHLGMSIKEMPVLWTDSEESTQLSGPSLASACPPGTVLATRWH